MNTVVSQQLNPFQADHWTGARPRETEKEAAARIRAMQEASRKSREIETWLLEQNKDLERRRKGVKILLLGQSESGKSSVLKNFQLAFTPKQFDSERLAWKVVVQLNVIGSIKTILDALEEEHDSQTLKNPGENGHVLALLSQKMRLSLSPLFIIELNLLKMLSPECLDCRGMIIRAGDDWKALLQSKSRAATGCGALDPTSVLVAQRDEIVALWRNTEVQQILAKRRPKLRCSSGFFMEDIERMTTTEFLPTNSDIIRARLQTIGIEESHFSLEKNREGRTNDFYITDVAGVRSQRASWVPYFDDAQCILFLAPLAFNEVLEEDTTVNRIEDSFELWRLVCENKLLANAQIILFLNKKDVLEATLASGVKVRKFVPTYKDRPNDVPTVTKYFKDRFKHYHKKYSPTPRSFLCHETSAIDITSMQTLLSGVREAMLRDLLTNNRQLSPIL